MIFRKHKTLSQGFLVCNLCLHSLHRIRYRIQSGYVTSNSASFLPHYTLSNLASPTHGYVFTGTDPPVTGTSRSIISIGRARPIAPPGYGIVSKGDRVLFQKYFQVAAIFFLRYSQDSHSNTVGPFSSAMVNTALKKYEL